MGPPKLTPEQRARALEKAAEARRKRAEVKELLKNATITLPELFERAETDEYVAGMKVKAVLASLPGLGKVKSARLMRDLSIAENRRVRGLGTRQREALLAAPDSQYPTRRKWQKETLEKFRMKFGCTRPKVKDEKRGLTEEEWHEILRRCLAGEDKQVVKDDIENRVIKVDMDDAEWEISELESLGQPPTIKSIQARATLVYPEYLNRYLNGLRKAGVPEE